MKKRIALSLVVLLCVGAVTCAVNAGGNKATSYSPVNITTPFADTMAKMKADKPAIMKKHETLLQERYDLKNAPAKGVTMTRGKGCAGRRSRQTAARHDLGEACRPEP